MLAGRLRSVRVALRGVRAMLRTERNAWIHAVATVATVALGVALGPSAPRTSRRPRSWSPPLARLPSAFWSSDRACMPGW